MTDVVIYRLGDWPVLQQAGRSMLPDNALALMANCFMWTESDRADQFTPSRLIVNTMATRFTYTQPRLALVRGGLVIFRAFAERAAPSGTVPLQVGEVLIVLTEFVQGMPLPTISP